MFDSFDTSKSGGAIAGFLLDPMFLSATSLALFRVSSSESLEAGSVAPPILCSSKSAVALCAISGSPFDCMFLSTTSLAVFRPSSSESLEVGSVSPPILCSSELAVALCAIAGATAGTSRYAYKIDRVLVYKYP